MFSFPRSESSFIEASGFAISALPKSGSIETLGFLGAPIADSGLLAKTAPPSPNAA